VDFSTNSMLVSLVVGTIGLGLFRYGKKQERPPQLLGGVALMVYPLFVTSVAGMLTVGGSIIAAIILAVSAGY
jgi:hypothetical protein